MYSRKEMGPTDTKTSHKEDVAVIALSSGTDNDAKPRQEKELIMLMQEGKRQILLNFSEMTCVSSGRLRGILSMAKQLRLPEIKFGLCCLSPEVNKILVLPGVISVITISFSGGDALDACQ